MWYNIKIKYELSNKLRSKKE
ncbi:UNVERIFIED_CONTAM: hypothetical protein GTU68_044233 [Idotea baltica]|nr:hypothetical protein [Idotea baltica]